MKLFSLLILTLQNPFLEFTKLMPNQFAFGFAKEVLSHKLVTSFYSYILGRLLRSRGGTLRISGWGCAAGTLEPLTYTRASSAEFCYPILELTPQIPPILE